MKANVNMSFECESAETHSTNAMLNAGLKVIQSKIYADHNLRNSDGNRHLAANFVRGIVENKDIIASLIGFFSPKAAQFVKPMLVLVEKVAKGEKMTSEESCESAEPETESESEKN